MSDVNHAAPTFLELYAADKVGAEAIDDFIDAWHELDASEERSLAEFLGMTEDKYTIWLASRKALPLIVAARRNRQPLVDIVAEYLAELRRGEHKADQPAIHVLSNWLSQRTS